MAQKNVVFQYGNTNVTFLAEGDNVKINATEMAKPFGEKKKPALWLRTQQAKKYLEFLTQVQICTSADLLIVMSGGNGQQGT